MSRGWLVLGTVVLLGLGPIGLPAPRPNIVLILADDLGYSDLGCYGGEIRAPNLDRLARNGLRFSQFYNAGRCCPTRAALMTGLYPHQAGVGRMTFDEGLPGYRGYLTSNTVTIAELLRAVGYHTAMVGKWHLSPTRDGPDNARWVSHLIDLGPFSDPKTYPVARGFEEHYGTIWGVVDYFDPFSLVHNTEPVRSVPKGYYYTDALSEWAVKFIEKYSRDGRPFFLYVAYTAPHWPLHVPPEEIEKYKDTYAVGWDRIRERRYQRLIEDKLLDPKTARLSPRIQPELNWEQNPHQAWDARAMAVHAAMVDRMDQGIGRIVGRLEQLGLLENTVIFFLSDNGASPEQPERFGPGFDRPSHLRDGTPIIYPRNKEVLPGAENTYAGIGPMWANVANTPFRYWKKESFEGGIATPLIVHWPGGLKLPPGSVTHEVGHVIDIMATCLELAGAAYPETWQGRRITPLEGKSLVPIFEGRPRQGHQLLFWEHMGGRAVREGRWKLVALPGQPWELYDLSEDRTELNNLAGKLPGVVQRLEAAWNQWARRAQVLPRPSRAR